MRVAVLRGGRSGEHDVSLASGAAVADGLREAGHEVAEVLIERDGRWLHEGEEVALHAAAGLLGCDTAWPVLHGPYGEDGTVQGLLELLGTPYVGAGVLASSLSMDKVLFKDVMKAAGVPQVAYAAVRRDETPDLAHLGLPVFVKPNRLGSSVGISKVSSAEELGPALAAAHEWDEIAIVEAFSGGLEVECAVLGNGAPETAQLGEVFLPTAEWYDYEAKYQPGGVELIVPARVPEPVAAEVRRIAVETFARVGCRGLARVDFFVEGERVLLNELNTMPGFTPTSGYPHFWARTGVEFPELCDRLVRLSLEAGTG